MKHSKVPAVRRGHRRGRSPRVLVVSVLVAVLGLVGCASGGGVELVSGEEPSPTPEGEADGELGPSPSESVGQEQDPDPGSDPGSDAEPDSEDRPDSPRGEGDDPATEEEEEPSVSNLEEMSDAQLIDAVASLIGDVLSARGFDDGAITCVVDETSARFEGDELVLAVAVLLDSEDLAAGVAEPADLDEFRVLTDVSWVTAGCRGASTHGLRGADDNADTPGQPEDRLPFGFDPHSTHAD